MKNKHFKTLPKVSFIAAIVACFAIYSCENNTIKKQKKVLSQKKIHSKSNSLKKTDSLPSQTKLIVTPVAMPTKNKNTHPYRKTIPSLPSPKEPENTTTQKTTINEDKKYEAFVHFRKMLEESKTGETLTQKQLSKYHHIPQDAIKLIKSITKISDNEIAIKWHSTWMLERISDATFEDATMKMHFDKDKMYTSGKAIGIKYNKKTYNDLIIVGNTAYIPTIKGYHWKIGK